jgi:hypothetical protein
MTQANVTTAVDYILGNKSFADYAKCGQGGGWPF